MKGKLLKKVTAAALSLLIVSGGIPFQPIGDLFGSTVLKAEAKTYDGWSHVNCTSCSVGDIFEAGAELFNDTSSPIYLQFSDNSGLNETLAARQRPLSNQVRLFQEIRRYIMASAIIITVNRQAGIPILMAAVSK